MRSLRVGGGQPWEPGPPPARTISPGTRAKARNETAARLGKPEQGSARLGKAAGARAEAGPAPARRTTVIWGDGPLPAPKNARRADPAVTLRA